MKILNIILGDQLDPLSAVFEGDKDDDHFFWMAEVVSESTRVWSHKVRTAYFISAMRHFRDTLVDEGRSLTYRTFNDTEDTPDFNTALERDIENLRPDKLRMVPPGEYHLYKTFTALAKAHDLELEWLPDNHFRSSPKAFREYAKGRKQLRMEYFYRELRKRFDILMDPDGSPAGGGWNYDSENRGSFPKSGPPDQHHGPTCKPDYTTLSVLELVGEAFPDHPGSLDDFRWPICPQEAEKLLDEFVETRLAQFGDYQDAMWTNEPWLYHSWISAALNLKLLNPRTVCQKAEDAWKAGKVPLNAVEGFIRQVLGWREYVRGIYWHFMPDYADGNALDANEPLPDFYWTGKTEYSCLRESIGQTLRYGYAHHIQRLMVTGLYALLLGVKPKAIHEWYLAVYVDAVEWVELPNVIGMSQFADGGLMASKPYAATGKYIQRMSNYCSQCPKNPAIRTGPGACPFTTLYWDFLLRNQARLRNNQRMSMQLRNLDRIDENERVAIRKAAAALRKN